MRISKFQQKFYLDIGVFYFPASFHDQSADALLRQFVNILLEFLHRTGPECIQARKEDFSTINEFDDIRSFDNRHALDLSVQSFFTAKYLRIF